MYICVGVSRTENILKDYLIETLHFIDNKVQRGEVIFTPFCKLMAEPGSLTFCHFTLCHRADILKNQLFMRFVIQYVDL